MPTHSDHRPLGAYGLRLEGVDGAEELLCQADPAWPRLLIETHRGGSDDDPDEVGPDHASLRLRTGGRVLLDRVAGRALIRTPRELRSFEIVHPYLAPAAAVMAYWFGRESFHGGAVAVDDFAWGILGDREAGKSTLLAELAVRGAPVLSDDQLVADEERCFAGPRSVDLREAAGLRLGTAEELGLVGARERWRLALGPVPPELPLAGWFYLDWGDSVDVTPLSGAARVERLARHRGLNVPPRDPQLLLALAALPSFVLTRPKDWGALGEGADRLLDAAGSP